MRGSLMPGAYGVKVYQREADSLYKGYGALGRQDCHVCLHCKCDFERTRTLAREDCNETDCYCP